MSTLQQKLDVCEEEIQELKGEITGYKATIQRLGPIVDELKEDDPDRVKSMKELAKAEENLNEANICLGIKEALQTEFMTTIREERRLTAESFKNKSDWVENNDCKIWILEVLESYAKCSFDNDNVAILLVKSKCPLN